MVVLPIAETGNNALQIIAPSATVVGRLTVEVAFAVLLETTAFGAGVSIVDEQTSGIDGPLGQTLIKAPRLDGSTPIKVPRLDGPRRRLVAQTRRHNARKKQPGAHVAGLPVARRHASRKCQRARHKYEHGALRDVAVPLWHQAAPGTHPHHAIPIPVANRQIPRKCGRHLGQPGPRCTLWRQPEKKRSKVRRTARMRVGNGGGRGPLEGASELSEVPSATSGLMLQPVDSSSSARSLPANPGRVTDAA